MIAQESIQYQDKFFLKKKKHQSIFFQNPFIIISANLLNTNYEKKKIDR